VQIRHEVGFDKPLPVQYVLLMKRLFITQDLTSFVNRGPEVIPQVLEAMPAPRCRW
jgi:peptide/nickel transport system permease protein